MAVIVKLGIGPDLIKKMEGDLQKPGTTDSPEVIANRLQNERDAAVETISKLEHQLAEPKDPDFEERSVEREQDEVLELQIEKIYSHLHHIDAAISRTKNGTYGICPSCGEPISEARLKAIPTALLCRNCVEK